MSDGQFQQVRHSLPFIFYVLILEPDAFYDSSPVVGSRQ